LEAHYSPQAEVKLEGPVSIGDGFLALANIPTPEGAVRLGSPNTTEEFAKIMYKTLRLCDRLKIRRIIVIEPIGDGLAEAIRDRLYKSSQVRS
jgi:L-threonylcarbamoyladenylate synthase